MAKRRSGSVNVPPPQVDLKSFDTGMADMVGAYKELVKEFGLSKVPKYMSEAAHRIGDRRFNALIAGDETYKHMFEWGTKGGSPASRLWKTVYDHDTSIMTYIFLPSRKLVPKADEFTKFRHTFEAKAAVMEEAPVVDIKPQQAKFLRWRKGEQEVRSMGVRGPVAGAKYKGKFDSAFLLFWTTGGGGTTRELAHAMRSSGPLRTEYTKNKIAGLKRRITNQQKKADAGDAKVKAMAKQRIKEIEMEVIKLGGKL